MPKSKGRQKRTGTRYQLEPARKQKSTSSPRWYGPLVLGVMGLGVITIVANYMGLIPGTDRTAENLWLFVGLGLIGVGFIGTTFWR
jgi:hypothetical protein